MIKRLLETIGVKSSLFISIKTTVLDSKLSNTFEKYEAHMNAPEQQAIFKEMGVETFYIGKSLIYNSYVNR